LHLHDKLIQSAVPIEFVTLPFHRSTAFVSIPLGISWGVPRRCLIRHLRGRSTVNKTSWIYLMAIACCARSGLSTEYYVDPKLGKAENDGSHEKPWKSLQEVVDKGLISSQQWPALPYRPGSRLVPKNPDALIKPGDTIFLRSGFYGQLEIQDYYNTGPITIAAEDGHVPRFSRIRIRSSAFWTLKGLHVSPQFADIYETGTLIDLDAHGFRGPVWNIMVEDCRVFSVEDSSEWTTQDWNNLACNGIDVDGRNMAVCNCTFRNVNFGISVSASHSLVEKNTVVDCDRDYPGPPWIHVAEHKNGTLSSDCVIRNNLTSSVIQQPGVSLDHNVIVTDPQHCFIDIQARDLRLRADSPAVDAGSFELAPKDDIEGTTRPRGSGVDVGAFESH
jgi:hypothetical protein